jgi:hypothetical protein
VILENSLVDLHGQVVIYPEADIDWLLIVAATDADAVTKAFGILCSSNHRLSQRPKINLSAPGSIEIG